MKLKQTNKIFMQCAMSSFFTFLFIVWYKLLRKFFILIENAKVQLIKSRLMNFNGPSHLQALFEIRACSNGYGINGMIIHRKIKITL